MPSRSIRLSPESGSVRPITRLALGEHRTSRCRAALDAALAGTGRGGPVAGPIARYESMGGSPHPHLRSRGRFAAPELLDRRCRGGLHLFAHAVRAASVVDAVGCV